MASEVAYYTYIYAKVDKDKYQLVTGHTRSAILAGRFLSAVLAQLLYSYSLMDVRQLNYISFGCKPKMINQIEMVAKLTLIDLQIIVNIVTAQFVSLACGVALPSVGASLYFYSTVDNRKALATTTQPKCETQMEELKIEKNEIATKPRFSCHGALELFWIHFKTSYSNKIVIQWSFWWALAMCGFLQVKLFKRCIDAMNVLQ